MGIGRWSNSFPLTNSGLPAVGTVITVKNTGTNTLSTLTDAAGTPTGSSTFAADGRGNGHFYADDGIGYDLYDSGTLLLTDERVLDVQGRPALPVAFGTTPDKREPFAVNPVLNGPTILHGSGIDKIGVSESVTITGDFTGDTGSDPTFAWGADVFCITGASANDGKGLGTLTGLNAEMAIQTPAGVTFSSVIGLDCQAEMWGAGSGATVTNMYSARVESPTLKASAPGGSVTNAYGLFVGGPTIGSSSNYAIFADGNAPNRLLGRLDVGGTIVGQAGFIQLQSDFSNEASLTMFNQAGGGHATLQLGATTGTFAVNNFTGGQLVAVTGASAADTILTLNAPTGHEAAIYFDDSGTTKWIQHQVTGTDQLKISDWVNFRDQVILTRGATSVAALIELASSLTVDGLLTPSGGSTYPDAANIALGTTTGTKIGTATTQKLGFYNATPVVQRNTTGTTTGFTAATGTAVLAGSTFTGNTGSTAYTIGDVVNALKLLGLMAS